MNAMLTLVTIVFSGVLATLTCLWIALIGPRIGGRRRMERRVRSVAARVRRSGVAQGARGGAIRKDAPSRFHLIERLIAPILPRPEMLRRRLQATGRPLTIGGYVAASIAVAALTVFSLWLPGGLSIAGSLALGVLAGLAIPHVAIGWLIARRVRRFEQHFPDAIDLMVRGLRSGLPVSETIAAAGREVAEPVGGEFRRVAHALKLGTPLEEALWETAHRLDHAEFKFFVVSLSVQRETGGNLAESLSNLSDILRRRRQMRLKIKAMSSEARASAMILGALPVIMFAIIYMLNPDYESLLFTDPRGKAMLALGVGLMVVGAGVMRKMVRFEI